MSYHHPPPPSSGVDFKHPLRSIGNLQIPPELSQQVPDSNLFSQELNQHTSDQGGKLKWSSSTLNIRDQAVADAIRAASAEKRRNKLRYHRTSVACGHCRRRKIRCILAPGDLQNRCASCIRLKKECNFYPVDQPPQPKLKGQRGAPSGRGLGRASSSASPADTQNGLSYPNMAMPPYASGHWRVNNHEPLAPAFPMVSETFNQPQQQNCSPGAIVPGPQEDLNWVIPQRSVFIEHLESLPCQEAFTTRTSPAGAEAYMHGIPWRPYQQLRQRTLPRKKPLQPEKPRTARAQRVSDPEIISTSKPIFTIPLSIRLRALKSAAPTDNTAADSVLHKLGKKRKRTLSEDVRPIDLQAVCEGCRRKFYPHGENWKQDLITICHKRHAQCMTRKGIQRGGAPGQWECRECRPYEQAAATAACSYGRKSKEIKKKEGGERL
ncbi:hypothetical protein V494_02925 [Pseudogymnoascus sp. VKM F-4513 (FW-928)]|nr:hypothetical protein V494_02925 [Pseudogymnoascus sp. VKM F-4513 (FW-928)]